jgi:murein endopeptidase
VRALSVASLILLGACAAPGLLTDGTSISVGTFSHGLLRHGARLPESGEGYLVPPLWAVRDSSWGTDEIVDAIERVARRTLREGSATRPTTRALV